MDKTMMLIILLLLVAFISAVNVEWRVFTDHSVEGEMPIGLCVEGQYIYATGFNRSLNGASLYVEKRDVRDGRLIKTWKSQVKGSGWLTGCVVSGNRLYVVGYVNGTWSIFSLNLDLSDNRENKSLVRGVPFFVISDGRFLYIAGYESVGIDGERWRVEKWNIGNLSLVGIYSPSNVKYLGRALAIGLNPKTRQLWVVGYNSTNWHLEVLRENLSSVAVLRPDLRGRALGVVFDEEGNAYVYGIGGVIKYGVDGRELARAMNFNVSGAAYVNGTLFIVTMDNWLIIFDKNLGEMYRAFLYPEVSKHVDVERNVRVERVVSDGKVLYIAGRVQLGSNPNWKWVIYAVPLPIAIKVSLVVVDGFGSERNWVVEVLDANGRLIARGEGRLTAVMLLGEKYFVKVNASRAYTTYIVANDSRIRILVPTAILNVVVVDSLGRPIVPDAVFLNGTRLDKFTNVEVVAGRYVIKVRVAGKTTETEISLLPGQRSTETIRIPTVSTSPLGSSSMTQTSSLISPTSPLANNMSEQMGGGGLFTYFTPLIVVVVVIVGLVVWGFVLRRPRIERVGGEDGDFCI